MAVRRKRARVEVDEDEDEAEAEDDQYERKLDRAIKWELLLYHARVPEYDEAVSLFNVQFLNMTPYHTNCMAGITEVNTKLINQIIRGVYGDTISETSREWSNAVTKMVDMQKNKKYHVLDNMRVSFIFRSSLL